MTFQEYEESKEKLKTEILTSLTDILKVQSENINKTLEKQDELGAKLIDFTEKIKKINSTITPKINLQENIEKVNSCVSRLKLCQRRIDFVSERSVKILRYIETLKNSSPVKTSEYSKQPSNKINESNLGVKTKIVEDKDLSTVERRNLNTNEQHTNEDSNGPQNNDKVDSKHMNEEVNKSQNNNKPDKQNINEETNDSQQNNEINEHNTNEENNNTHDSDKIDEKNTDEDGSSPQNTNETSEQISSEQGSA